MTNLGILKRARKLLNAAGRRHWKQGPNNRPSSGAIHSKRSKETESRIQPIWMETEAKITECREDLSRIMELPFRVTKAPCRLIVSFTYYAHAKTYYSDFRSPVARSLGEAFPVFYNALNPRQNTLSPSNLVNRRPLSATAVLGFILLSILFLAMAPGQH